MTKGQKGLWMWLGGLSVIGGALFAIRYGEKKKLANQTEEDVTEMTIEDSAPVQAKKDSNTQDTKTEVKDIPTSNETPKDVEKETLKEQPTKEECTTK